MGLRIRQIKLDAEGRPELDEQGREIETSSIEIPAEVEAEGPAAVDAYVAARRSASPEVEAR